MRDVESPVGAANTDSTLDRLAFCIAATTTCAQTCMSCADAALAGSDLHAVRRWVRTAQDCAGICTLTVELLLRFSGRDHEVTRYLIRTCIAACRACRRECEQHASALQFCGSCAAACRLCEQSCVELAPTLLC